MTARRLRTYETTALDAIENGAQAIVELAEEMRSWYDNMPENFQNSERGERVSEAADSLEYSDIESRASELAAAVDACEGQVEILGCPEHTIGTPCSICGWNGQPLTGRQWPRLEEYDEGSTGFYNGFVGRVDYDGQRLPVSYVDEWTFRQLHGQVRDEARKAIPAEKVEAARVSLRKLWWAKAEDCVRVREQYARKHPNAAPRRREHKPEVPGVCGFTDAVQLKVTLPSGKRRQSRRDRLDAALDGVRVGCEALTQLIKSRAEWRDDGRTQAVLEACDELLSACDECDSVECPGMHG